MTNYCLALPYLSGGIELAKRFAEKDCGHNKEHDAFYKIAGVNRENVWIQMSLPGSNTPDLELVSLETDDPEKMLKEFPTSSHPWAVRFRQYATEAYGTPYRFTKLCPLNKSIIDWRE